MRHEKGSKDYWSTSVPIGNGREVVYAWERHDRGGRVFVKFPDPAKTGRDRRTKRALEGIETIRDGKGRIDKRKEREALDAVRTLAARLHLGMGAFSTPSTQDGELPLTIREGFEALLDHATGKFPTPSRRWDEVRRAQRKLERILGAELRWIDITPADARKVWRKLAEEAKAANDGAGARQAEVTVDALYSTANWLRGEGTIPLTAALAVNGWRRRLFDDWKRLTGVKPTVSRPRHTPEEMGRLFAHLYTPEVDARFALAFDLGGEQRIGQVLNCKRSDLELAIVEHDARMTTPPGGLGILRVPGEGKKLASPILLTSSQRVAVDDALRGYLSDLENAYRAGAIPDYPLFPAGRLKEGKSKLVPALKVLSRDAARKMFMQLEMVAKVEHVPGRCWYGVRRVATDLAEDVTTDERILNSITGHKDSTTRRLYQEPDRLDVLRGAAETRDLVRRGLRGEPEVDVRASRNSA